MGAGFRSDAPAQKPGSDRPSAPHARTREGAGMQQNPPRASVCTAPHRAPAQAGDLIPCRGHIAPHHSSAQNAAAQPRRRAPRPPPLFPLAHLRGLGLLNQLSVSTPSRKFESTMQAEFSVPRAGKASPMRICGAAAVPERGGTGQHSTAGGTNGGGQAVQYSTVQYRGQQWLQAGGGASLPL